MIRNQREFDYARERTEDFTRQVEATRAKLMSEGFEQEVVDLANASTLAFIQDLAFDCQVYESLRARGPAAVPAYPAAERGKALIALRIACGLSQKELGERRGVSEAQVSRDERNEYHGITQDRYANILEAFGVEEQGVRFVRKRERPLRAYLGDRPAMRESSPLHDIGPKKAA